MLDLVYDFHNQKRTEAHFLVTMNLLAPRRALVELNATDSEALPESTVVEQFTARAEAERAGDLGEAGRDALSVDAIDDEVVDRALDVDHLPDGPDGRVVPVSLRFGVEPHPVGEVLADAAQPSRPPGRTFPRPPSRSPCTSPC